MRKDFIAIVFMTTLLSSCAARDNKQDNSPPPPSEAERMAFLSANENIGDFLNEKLKSHRLLFIGFRSHGSMTQYRALTDLLKHHQETSSLRTIVMERSKDKDVLWSGSSTFPLESLINTGTIDQAEIESQICAFNATEWKSSMAYFFPELRRINQLRKDAPIIVRAIDSITDADETRKSKIDFPSSSQDCSTQKRWADREIGLFSASHQRENQTAKNMSDLYKKLPAGESAVILYNFGHLLREGTSCLVDIPESGTIRVTRGRSSWLQYFFESHPEALRESSVVVLDNSSGPDPRGPLFPVLRSESERRGGRSFAIEAKNLAPVTPHGSDILSKSVLDVDFREDMVLTDLVDGAIWMAPQDEPIIPEFPSYCE